MEAWPFLGSWPAAPASAAARPGAASTTSPPLELRFNELRFDPLVALPAMDEHLRRANGLTIVQFDGPISTERRAALEGAGAVIIWYLPHYGYLVAADAADAARLHQVAGVRWVGPLLGGHVLSQDLQQVIRDQRAGVIPPGAEMEVMISTVGPQGPVLDAVALAGGRIRWTDPMYIQAVIPVRTLTLLAESPAVGFIARALPAVPLNNNAARIVGARQQADGPFTNPGTAMWSWNNFQYPGLANGTGITVADADTGVDGTHKNFPAWKKVWYSSYGSGVAQWGDCNGHGTHTSGSAVGAGISRTTPNPAVDGLYVGVAPGAKLVGQAILCGGGAGVYTYANDAYRNGATVSTNSWGAGGIYGDYNSQSSAYDTYIRDADVTQAGEQPLTVVFAVGNDGPTAATIGPPATGKNMISSGASGNNKGGLGSGSVAGFSGRGPTDDGRIKPDLVAPGAAVTSSWRGGTDFTSASGTSMSTPITAGGAAVIQSYWNTTKGSVPSPALTKSLMITGADVMAGYTYPGNVAGFGRMNVARSVLETPTRKIVALEQNATMRLQTGDHWTIPMTVIAGSEFKVSLVWSDEAGSSNNPDPSLVNDLDLIAISPSGLEYQGNNLAGGNSVAGCKPDRLNNVEVVRFTAPEAGAWRLIVAGRNVPLGPQDFAMVSAGNIAPGGLAFKRVLDLEATDISVVAKAIEGDAIIITGNVTNLGDWTPPTVDWIIVHNETETLASGTIPNLAGAAKVQVQANWTAVRGPGHSFTLAVDPLACRCETGRDNNNKTARMDVLFYDQSLSSSKTSIDALPGATVDFTLLVDNLGTAADSYDLTASTAAPGWNATLAQATSSPMPGARATVGLGVTVPGDALADSKVQTTATMTSRDTGTVSSASVTVRVLQLAGIGLEIGPAELDVLPGAQGTFIVNVTNAGNGRDSFNLDLTGTPTGWSGALAETSVVIEAFATSQITLQMGPLAGTEAGDRALLTVSATSVRDPTLRREVQATATTMAVHDLAVQVTEEGTELRPGGGLNYTVTLENRGNIAETVDLAGTPPEEGWTLTFDEAEVTVDAGSTREVGFTVRAPRDALAGAYSFDITWDEGISPGSWSGAITVLTVRGMTLKVAPATLAFDEKTKSGEIVVTLKNTGNAPDSFKLNVVTVGDLRVTLSNKLITLLPGAEGKLKVTVAPVVLKDLSAIIDIDATSEGDPAMKKTSAVRVTVVAPKPVIRKPGTNPFQDDPNDVRQTGPAASLYIGAVVGLIALMVGAILAMRYFRKRKGPGPTELPPATGPALQPGQEPTIATQMLGPPQGAPGAYGETFATPAYEPLPTAVPPGGNSMAPWTASGGPPGFPPGSGPQGPAVAPSTGTGPAPQGPPPGP